ncbi:MAG: VWA domain-containing protein [Pyrinomonadaceae bacterium]
MKLGIYSIVILILLSPSALAQSGRTKPTPSPTPDRERPRVIYVPREWSSVDKPLPKNDATPTPTPAKPATDDDDVLKIESTLVPIPVSVVDSHGRAVTSLRLEDFELSIDGRRVAIGEVTRAATPIRLAMLFDNSSSVLIAREFEKEAAVKFFKRVLRPERDMAALFTVADATRMSQPLTRDVSLLLRAVESLPQPEGATALLDGILEVADYLRESALDGRRVIVIVSDGEDTYSDYSTTLEKVIRRLQFTNCQVYVVKTKDFENFKRTGQRGGNANIRVLDAERRMQEIASQTGGAVYSPLDEREMETAFARISGELSDQYILSYYPETETGKPGDFRQITVTVKSNPNLTVRTRKGYYVPKR